MRKAIVLFLYALPLLKASAQDHKLDSLNNLLIHANTDTSKIDLLGKISSYFYNDLNRKDSAILITKRCIQYANEHRLTSREVNAMIQLGNQYEYYQKAD